MLAVALLAALIALSTLADGARLKFDVPLVAGVSAAGLAVWRRAPFVVVVVLGAAVAAGLRLLLPNSRSPRRGVNFQPPKMFEPPEVGHRPPKCRI